MQLRVLAPSILSRSSLLMKLDWTSGVTRHMYSAFWSLAYEKMFDGSNTLLPLMPTGADHSAFIQLGWIIVHGFLTAQMLPICIAFPVLACTLLSPSIKIPDDILVSAFVDYLTPFESDILKRAIAELGDDRKTEFSEKSALINLVSRFGARKLPTKENLKAMIRDIAELKFIIQPLPACHLMNQGIPTCHKDFWATLTVQELHALFQSMAVTARKVVESIVPPAVYNNPNEERVFEYLLQSIGTFQTEEQAKFLRFVTGSSVFIDRQILVTFNSLSGLARRPIAHCCSCTLELSSEYDSYFEFSQEMKMVVNDQSAFIMNAM